MIEASPLNLASTDLLARTTQMIIRSYQARYPSTATDDVYNTRAETDTGATLFNPEQLYYMCVNSSQDAKDTYATCSVARHARLGDCDRKVTITGTMPTTPHTNTTITRLTQA